MSQGNWSRLKSKVVKLAGVPVRTCLGCRRKKPKAELIRLCVNAEGRIILDKKGTKAGRGGYLCLDECCIDAVRKKARVSARYVTTIPDTVFTELENLVGNSYQESGCG